jgi:hypothetical protein
VVKRRLHLSVAVAVLCGSQGSLFIQKFTSLPNPLAAVKEMMPKASLLEETGIFGTHFFTSLRIEHFEYHAESAL